VLSLVEITEAGCPKKEDIQTNVEQKVLIISKEYQGRGHQRGDLYQLHNEKPQKSLKPAQVSPDEVLLRTHL